jgi:hypothetical protein
MSDAKIRFDGAGMRRPTLSVSGFSKIMAIATLLGIIALVWRFLDRAQWWWLWGV